MFPRTLAFALALFATPSAAQVGGPRTLRRAPRPLEALHLDLGTGVFTRAPVVKSRAATTTVDFYNNDLGGFIGNDTGGGFCEWFDAATKGFAQNGSDLMSSIVFPYCSCAVDPSIGGPGGTMKLGFYEGYVTGGGAPTTTVAAFTLAGLPSNTGSSCFFFGGFRCFFLEASFAPMVAFADGPIGYSWKFLDVGTTGVQAATWPFLSCVVSCSGTLLQVDAQGMTDRLDEYCPPGSLRSSFTFGSTSGTFTSIAMEIREASDVRASSQAYNATLHPNPDRLSAGVAVLGRTFPVTLARSPSSAAGFFTLLVRTIRLRGDGVGPPPPVQGRMLVSGPRLARLTAAHDGTTGSLNTTVPLELALLGQHFAMQAVVSGSGLALSSAVEGVVGTF
jgi:hypothetical protein